MPDTAILALFVALPTAAIAFLGSVVRRWILVLSAGAGLTIDYTMNGGPDNPLLIIPMAFFVIAASALLIELLVVIRRIVRHSISDLVGRP
jgi:hypothetical protein